MPLASPVTAVALQRSAGKLGRAAVACMQGVRNDFEDCHTLDQDRGICGVFDGHLGDSASAFCAERLSALCAAAPSADALASAFAACDAQLRELGGSAGSTAVLAKVLQNGNHDAVNLLVANCGDSRALLWRKTSRKLEVTRDHRPTDPEERLRIEAAGGFVDLDRVDGKLACSRALGAFEYKEGAKHKVSNVPEIYRWSASIGDWLILGCDGVWDTLSNELVVERIENCQDLGQCLEEVLHLCIQREADDNLTLMAVELGHVKPEALSTSMSPGSFLKMKDPDVLRQYVSFCQRFGFSIQKEVREKGPPSVSLSKTEPTPPRPRFPPAEAPTPLVIVGPSGVGKGTLITKIRESFAGRFGFSVSHTTRKPRPGEVHGEAYNFVDLETMKKEVEIPGRFLEWALVHGNIYGTSNDAVQRVRDQNQICILDVDVQGAQQIKKLHGDFNYLFIAPPSLAELEQRLRSRGTETEEKVLTRLRNAKSEVDWFNENRDFFNAVLVNDDLGLAIRRARDLMRRWYPHLLQQVKVTARRPAGFFVHAARELARQRPAELEISGLGSAIASVSKVSEALQSDGHALVEVSTASAEVTSQSGRTSSVPKMTVRIRIR